MALPPRIASLHQALIDMIPVDKPIFRPALEALPLPRAMIAYLNLVDSFVPPRPRMVGYGDSAAALFIAGHVSETAFRPLFSAAPQ